MNSKNIHFKLVNATLAFVLLLVLASSLPHHKAHVLSWVNYGLYFLLFLQCVFIVRKETHNKFLFINIGLFCVAYAFSFLTMMIGDNFVIGNKNLAVYVYTYRTILLQFLLAVCVVSICVKYVAPTIGALGNYLATLGIILPVLLWHYFPFIADPAFVLASDYRILDKSTLYFTLFSFSAVCYYGFLLYQKERSLGEHMNSLMVCFFIMTLLDIADVAGSLYNIKMFSISQYILLIILAFFIVTLSRKLTFVYSPFGQFYDSLVIGGNDMGVPIKRKSSPFVESFMDVVKEYFHHRRNAIAFVMFFVVFLMHYFSFSTFLRVNIAAAVFALVVLFFYLSALHNKRVTKGNLVAIRHSIEHHGRRRVAPSGFK